MTKSKTGQFKLEEGDREFHGSIKQRVMIKRPGLEDPYWGRQLGIRAQQPKPKRSGCRKEISIQTLSAAAPQPSWAGRRVGIL